ncbi:MAG: glycosyltransferase [Actinobacteria bacterium]|nr:glycosyltransferase [Actinomycetota bacterium]
MSRSNTHELPTHVASSSDAPTLLSVVVPVYNQADIVDNVQTIRERVESKLGEPIELIVVSDGDAKSEEALAETSLARVIHYDRNLGKGYAVKIGALAARGRFISYVDADLDLDPASLPDFLRLAEDEKLDFVIGSKRHPGSDVHYPRSRRIGSWFFQQLVRLLFRLNVRDTQVGLKLFRREVAEDVLPLLLVKQFAFDLEFLAVARALGYEKIREQPVRLEYRFTGSGVRSGAVLLALIDTAAIFYRLRILRYYQRKRDLLPAYARVHDFAPRVALVAPEPPPLAYSALEVVEQPTAAPESRAAALHGTDADLVGFLAEGAVPAANWLDATVPFFANSRIAAVVTPSLAPAHGSVRERAAAALQESWLGGGSHYFRFTPGNLRFVKQFPGANLVARRAYLEELPEPELHPDRIIAALTGRGRFVLYTPETVLVQPRPPLFRPHLAPVAALGRSRGRAIRKQGRRGLSGAALPPLALLTFFVAGWALALLGGVWLVAWGLVWAAYVALVLLNALLGGLRFRSVRVAALACVGSIAVHLTYATALVLGLIRR